MRPTDPTPRAVRLAAGAHRWCRCAQAAGVCPATCEAGAPFTVERTRWMGLCTCGRTATPPECDGSHAAYRPSLLARLQARLRQR